MLIKDELELLHEFFDLDPRFLLYRIKKLLSRICNLPNNFAQYKCEIRFLENYEKQLSDLIEEEK